MYILRNWQIIRHLDVDGDAVVRLGGEVFGHPRFRAGAAISTSAIVEFRPEGDTLVVATSNGSTYFLGRPNIYEAFAKQRLIRLLEARVAETAARPGRPVGDVFDPQRTDLQLGAAADLRQQHADFDSRRLSSRRAEE